MVLEHEIPQGSTLYFGASARLKRHIEQDSSALFYERGFEEIATPIFSYLQHQETQDERGVLRLSGEKNHQIVLRSDSTTDVVRILTKRLDRSTSHTKWFYIQPLLRYPTEEVHQIGVEVLEGEATHQVLQLALDLMEALSLSPKLLLSNLRIPTLAATELGLPLEMFRTLHLEQLLALSCPWLHTLFEASDEAGLLLAEEASPAPIAREIRRLREVAASICYDEILYAPLFYAKMRYYDEFFFRMFIGNKTLLKGGDCLTSGRESCGFALYTDEVVEQLMQTGKGQTQR